MHSALVRSPRHTSPFRRSRALIHVGIALASVALLASLAACGASSSNSSASSPVVPPGSSASTTNNSDKQASASIITTSATGVTVAPELPGAGGIEDPCGLVTLDDIRLVLAGAPQGTAAVPSGGGSLSVGSCVYKVDQAHRVLIQLESGPAAMMAAARAGAASQTDLVKVDGLGEAGYSSAHGSDSTVIFYVGDTQVQVAAFGQPDAALTVALAKKVAAEL